MLIECSYCQSRVDGDVLGENAEYDFENGDLPSKIVFVRCPACRMSLLGITERIQIGENEWKWVEATRLWPDPARIVHHQIPQNVRLALEEAKTCYRAKAPSACAVMCGRAIEAMCVAHTGERTLNKGLQALKVSGVIDNRLFEWGDSLRKERNIGAHASSENVSLQDARDVLDFAIAICEYVYVLSDRYERYKKRKEEREQAISPITNSDKLSAPKQDDVADDFD